MDEQTRFSLVNLYKLESSFWREEILSDEQEVDTPGVEIQVSWGRDQDKLRVYLTTTLEQTANQQAAIRANVRMVGYFDILGPHHEPSIKGFAEINAPAILFPYVREELASASLKAGIRPILLQPVNFVAMAQSSINSE